MLCCIRVTDGSMKLSLRNQTSSSPVLLLSTSNRPSTKKPSRILTLFSKVRSFGISLSVREETRSSAETPASNLLLDIAAPDRQDETGIRRRGALWCGIFWLYAKRIVKLFDKEVQSNHSSNRPFRRRLELTRSGILRTLFYSVLSRG